jgi:hypothetical protein
MTARARVKSGGKIKPDADHAGQPGRDSAPRGDDGEVARLTAELAAAHARIAELEQKQTEILHRVDWVIDSLQTLVVE